MHLYKMLRAAFGRSEKTPTAEPAERPPTHMHDAENDKARMTYVAQHLAEIAQVVSLLTEWHGPDFNAFFYRPKLADFIRKEAVHYRYPDSQYNDFLDNIHWANIHPFNFPGPFYTGESDTCETGPYEAPDNVLRDNHAVEYVFRQPHNFVEFVCIVDAAAIEVFDSYSCDGNDHWTYPLCQDWWRSKAEIIRRLNTPAFRKYNGNRVQLYIDYLNGAAETDLRKYCYFLENGRYPTGNESLPPL
jgi:hypothetical protein